MTTLASGWLFVLAALLTSLQPEGSSTADYQLVAEPAASFLLLAGEADVLSALLAACLLGGVVAGGLSPSAAGANGATVAAFGALAGISCLLLAVLPFSALPRMVSFVDPVSRSVETGTLAFWALASLAFSSLPSSRATLAAGWAVACGALPNANPREQGERRARVAGKTPMQRLV